MAYLTDEEIEARDDARSHAIDMAIEIWERKNAPGWCCGCAFLTTGEDGEAVCLPYEDDPRDPHDLARCPYHGEEEING